jgi:hypothetical protein
LDTHLSVSRIFYHVYAWGGDQPTRGTLDLPQFEADFQMCVHVLSWMTIPDTRYRPVPWQQLLDSAIIGRIHDDLQRRKDK